MFLMGRLYPGDFSVNIVEDAEDKVVETEEFVL